MLVDGGYLTFKLAFGGYDVWEFENGDAVDLLAWDSKPLRNDDYPYYKAQRREGGESAEQEIVRVFRVEVKQRTKLPLVCIEGLEADDIVACESLFNPHTKIIGIDKDYFQLPNIYELLHYDLKPWTYENTLDRLPKYIQGLADMNWSLYQAVYGDSSDGIPRLLAKGRKGKEQVETIVEHIDTPLLHDVLQSMFDDAVKENLKLVLLPYYRLYSGSEDWYTSWLKGDYYNQDNWLALHDMIETSKPAKHEFNNLW